MSEENTNTTDTTADNTKTEGTVRHNRELLNDLAKFKAKVAEYEAEKEARETAAAQKKGDYEALLKKEQDKAAKLAAEKKSEIEAREARINSLLTENALKDMIGAYDVKPSLRPALVALLKGQLNVTAEGVMVGDKSPDEFAKEFFASEDGRDFLKPLVNSGGGATGNTGTTPATPETWSLTKYAEMKAEDPVLAAAYAKKHNKRF